MLSNSGIIQASTLATIKRISWDEMQKRRAQGLCFDCNNKFTPGHRCQVPQLMILENIAQDDVTAVEVDSIKQEEETTPIERREGMEEPEITIHALTRWAAPRTMLINVTIKNREFIALIDSGSTRNFVNDRIDEALQLHVKPTEPFLV